MVKKYVKRRRFPKRKKNNRFRKRRPYTNRVKTVGPIAPRTITKLRYMASFSSGLVYHDSQFRLNSTYDPDFTGGGHQPYGRDTYASIYAKYRVFACSYRIRASTDSPQAVTMTIVPNNSSTPYSNAFLAAESPRAQTHLIGYGNPRTLRGKIYLPALTGVSPSTYKGDSRYAADIGANPSEDMLLHIVTSDMSGATTNKVQYQVELLYHVEFYDPYELAQS